MKTDDKILEIFNSEPFGFYPWKAEKMAEMTLKLLDSNTLWSIIDINAEAFKLWEKYTEIAVGKWVSEKPNRQHFSRHLYRSDEPDGWEKYKKECERKQNFQPSLLKPEHLWPGEEPTDMYTNEQYYGSEMDKYHESQKLVLFDGWEKRDSVPIETIYFDGKWIVSFQYDGNVFVKKPPKYTQINSIDHFIRETGAKVNHNFLKILIE